MKITYESTIEDNIYTQVELLRLTGRLSRQKWLGFSVWTVVCFVSLYFIIPGEFIKRFSIALPFSIMFGLFFLFYFQDLIEDRIRKALIKNLGTEDPIPCEYEINDEGITFRRLGTSIIFSWASVQEIRDEIDAIKIIVKPLGIALIPKRIFENQSDIQKWLDCMHSKVSEVRQNNPTVG